MFLGRIGANKFCSKLHVQGYATSHAPRKRVRDNYKSSRLGRLPGALWRVRWIHAQSLASDSAMTIPTRSESVAWKTGELFRRDLPGWLRGWDTSSSPGALNRGGRFRFQGWCSCSLAFLAGPEGSGVQTMAGHGHAEFAILFYWGEPERAPH